MCSVPNLIPILILLQNGLTETTTNFGIANQQQDFDHFFRTWFGQCQVALLNGIGFSLWIFLYTIENCDSISEYPVTLRSGTPFTPFWYLSLIHI